MFNIFRNKKGDFTALSKGVIMGILGLVVVLAIFAAATPVLLGALGNVTANLTGLPLLSFFNKDGIVVLIFVVAVLLAVIGYTWHMIKSKSM